MASGIVKWRRQQLSRLASTGVKLAPSPEWPKLMERVGRRDDVLDWITSNQAVHGNELIHLMGLGMRDGDVQVVGQPTPFLLSVVSVMAIGSALPLMRDASTLFGIPKPGNWSELELRRTTLVDLLNTDPGLIDPGQIPG
jgi:hypothetical protein